MKATNSSENLTSSEPSKPSQKVKENICSHAVPLTPSELQFLKEDSRQAFKDLEGAFLHLR